MNQRSVIFLIVLFIGTVLNLNVAGQMRSITASQYRRAENTAWTNQESRSRRIRRTEHYFKLGKLTSDEMILMEYVVPDRRRTVHTTRIGNKVETKETIEIGAQTYCRSGIKTWSTDCHSMLTGLDVPMETVYDYSYLQTANNGQTINLFRKYGTYKNTDARNADENGIMFVEWNLSLTDDALFMKIEFHHGYVGSNKWEAKTEQVWEYDPKGLKIDAPINRKRR